MSLPHDESPSPDAPRTDTSRGERLQKVLASAGIGSRRQCEELIAEGRVEVDRRVVTELGTRVDPAHQTIAVDGTRINARRPSYYVVNKPPGVVSTNRDPQGRPRVIDLVPRDERLFAVGRLDRSSEGLILVTNDGDLAHRLTHPRFGVAKTYMAMVAGTPHPEQLKKLVQGVHLAEGVARAAAVRVRKRRKGVTEVEIVLREGINREVRRLFARIGHKVLRLKRVSMGPIRLAGLPSGACRRLTRDEVKQLRALVNRGGQKGAPPTKRPRPTARSAETRSGRETRPRADQGERAASAAARSGSVLLPDDAAQARNRKRRPARSTGASGGKARLTASRNKPAHNKPAHNKPAHNKPAHNKQSRNKTSRRKGRP
jgi:23S rRNA pseudouridine2605 synthase